jgi:hypothetical protein
VGDQNTSLFHKQANVRVMKNNVREINLEDGSKIIEYEEIKEATR